MHPKPISAPPQRPRTPARRLLVLALLASTLPACSRRDANEPPRPNILIYLVDTLRPDHLGVYGYQRETSPALDAFARDAVVFDNAYTTAGWTKPACLSLLTGLNPPRHRAITRPDTVAAELQLLSEHLKALGYHTAAFVTNPNLIPLWGWNQGYDIYDDLNAVGRDTRADEVNASVFRRLDQRPAAPFFFYVHTMDPHGPFDAPPPFDTMFPRPRGGRVVPSTMTHDIAPELLLDAISAYDGEIAYNDLHFGKLLERLKQDRLYDDTLILFVADHGEELLDHGGGGHGHTLFQELLRVPLLIKFPRSAMAGKRVADRVSLIDIVPTLLAYLRQPAPPDLDGLDLLPLIRGEQNRLPDRPLFFDLDLQRADGVTNVARAVILGSLKYIRCLGPEPHELLYDLHNDPRERFSLLPKSAEQAQALAAMLDDYTLRTSTGIHLRLFNANDITDRAARVVLRTTGRFVALAPRLCEDTDTAELSPDGKSLTFRTRLVNYPHPTGGVPPWIVDEDSLTFRLEPPDAGLTIETLTLDDGAPLPLFLGAARTPAADTPLTLDPRIESLVVPDIAALLRDHGRPIDPVPLGAYLAVVPAAEQQTTMPEEVIERLRATGYIQ